MFPCRNAAVLSYLLKLVIRAFPSNFYLIFTLNNTLKKIAGVLVSSIVILAEYVS